MLSGLCVVSVVSALSVVSAEVAMSPLPVRRSRFLCRCAVSGGGFNFFLYKGAS